MKIRGQTVIPPKDRIEGLSTPEPNSGCWLWSGTTRPNAAGIHYGRLVVGSRSDGSRRSVAAHRYSYETFVGPIPDGLVVCHRCDIGICVNPDHLFVGSQSENMADAYKKGRVMPPWRRTDLPPPPQTGGSDE